MKVNDSYIKACKECKNKYVVHTWTEDGMDYYGHHRGGWSSGNNDEGCPKCGFNEKDEARKKEEAKEFIENNNSVFKNNEEIFDYLLAYYKKFGGKIRIASYGMYLGISKGRDWNNIYPSLTRKFFKEINKEDLYLLVGLPYHKECHTGCEYCKMSHESVLERFNDTKEMLNLNIRYHKESHLKLYNIGELYIAGGINLTISGYADAAFVITDENQQEVLRELYNKVWKESNKVIPKEE